MSKIIETILTIKISFLSTTYNILSMIYFGGYQGLSIEIALHNFIEKIYMT